MDSLLKSSFFAKICVFFMRLWRFKCVFEYFMCSKRVHKKWSKYYVKNIFLCQKRCTKNGSKNIITYYGFPIKIFSFCKNMHIFYEFMKILMCFWIFSVSKKGAQKMVHPGPLRSLKMDLSPKQLAMGNSI